MEKEVKKHDVIDKNHTDIQEYKETITKSETLNLKINKENEEKLYKFIEKLNKNLYAELFKMEQK